jgi:hypothetical protein
MLCECVVLLRAGTCSSRSLASKKNDTNANLSARDVGARRNREAYQEEKRRRGPHCFEPDR